MSLNFLNIFRSRRSIKEYLPKEVSNEVLSRILEAGRWAPSAHNAQPWRFIVVQDSATKQKLAKAMASRWHRDMSKNGIPKEQRESLIKASVERFENAPIIIIACLTMENMDEYPDEQRKRIEYVMAVQSVAAAIENVLLAAYGEGLGSCWFCAPLFCQDVVRKILKIPQHVDPQALITLGYPANRPNSPPRKALEEIVYQDHWRHTT
ncbi:MAG: nitroreductase family protein [Candidatus Bathyarchaeota archaeon]|nr:nitroreductase family protein [Candidatus Bathyarchaeota archaeon]